MFVWGIVSSMYYRGKKVRYLNFCNFMSTQKCKFLTFWFAGRCFKVLNLLWTLIISRKGNIFLAIQKILFLYIKGKANKKHTANNEIA